ncbi:LAETG motif-containing sortase-dependent surface protein [Streptomyces sp. NBC_01217]|uniref:LAETG motif-containing sortase-dependent surface protein n=1 Tax=Streptomyces sp. NBC_01217 TaxID=2903779 RepID=UPI002E100DE7|nr:LPXTG cell wall anchor domain-containing protein [Streptomyces sp. NBC_01217]
MKLRRAMALAAATAVIVPVAVLTAPAAFAGTPTPGTGSSASPTSTGTASTDAEPTAEAEPTCSATTGAATTGTAPEPDTAVAPAASTSVTPSDSVGPPSSPPVPEEQTDCEKSDLEISVNGLPGNIARGSGWHTFKMNVYNSSKTTVKSIDYFAGASSAYAGEDYLFKSNQVGLQFLDPDTRTWQKLDEDGRTIGYVGRSDEIPAGHEVDIPMRLRVEATAPLGAAFTLGVGFYVGDKDCAGVSDVAYKFKIVKSGDSGSKPQTGGSVPVPSTRPADNPTGRVSGALAETGSSSAVPVFATAGGAAVVLGAGAMFIVRRRRNGDTDA